MPCQQSVCWRERVSGKKKKKRGGEQGERRGENHFIGDTVKDLFEQAGSLSVLLY